jgi:diguanylate cyclase (GGDEF)-like protein/PAS domain S-box-containing protein
VRARILVIAIDGLRPQSGPELPGPPPDRHGNARRWTKANSLTGHGLRPSTRRRLAPTGLVQPGRAFWVQTRPGTADSASVDPEISELTAVSIRKDGFGGILACSDSIREVFGWDPAALVGTRSLDYIHPNDHDDVVSQWMAMLDQPGSTQVLRYRHRHSDGSWMNVEATNENRLDLEGSVCCSLIAMDKAADDLAEVGKGHSEISAIRLVRSGERLLRRLAEGLSLGVAYIAADGAVTYANSRCRVLLSLSAGIHMDAIPTARLDEKDSQAVREKLRQIMGTAGEATLTVVNQAESARPILRIVMRGLAQDAEGPAGIVLSIEDVTDVTRATEDLERRANTDPLTGVFNRAATIEFLQRELHENEKLAVAFVDVDRMKAQNDLLGHAGGDALLIDTARRLNEAVRPGDIVGRLGGDEFVAVCRHITTPAAATALAERLARSMQWVFSAGSHSFPVSASVGVVHCVDAESTAEVLAKADVAMYRAKVSGVGDPVMWNESLSETDPGMFQLARSPRLPSRESETGS